MVTWALSGGILKHSWMWLQNKSKSSHMTLKSHSLALILRIKKDICISMLIITLFTSRLLETIQVLSKIRILCTFFVFVFLATPSGAQGLLPWVISAQNLLLVGSEGNMECRLSARQMLYPLAITPAQNLYVLYTDTNTMATTEPLTKDKLALATTWMELDGLRLI